jgi:TonB family protein
MTPFLEYTIKVSLIVLAGLVASALLRRYSAAVRHWVLSMALLSALALPMISSALPAGSAWSITIGSPSITSRPRVSQASTTASSANDANQTEAEVALVRPSTWPAGASTIAALVPFAWIAGTSLSVLLLVVGLTRLTWLSSRARPVTDQRWTRLLGEIALRYGLRREVRVLQSEHPSLLVTWGAFRPRVIVPRLALDWPEDRIRVVLCHELAHIRRGDWLIQIAGEVLRSVYWFNPLLWIACRSLRQESEEACDDEVIADGVHGSDYAAHLLDAARALKHDVARWLPAPAIVRPSSLERRIRVMLNTGLTRTPATRAFRIAAALSLLGATTLVAAAQIGPATLSGSVVDSTGAPVPGVPVTLASSTSAAKYQVQTDLNGQFQFVPLPADQYVLRAQLPDFKDTEETLQLAGKAMRRDLKLALGSVAENISILGGPSDGVAGGVAGGVRGGVSGGVSAAVPSRLPQVLANCKPSRIGGNLRAPIKLKDVHPEYSERLQAAGISGTVMLTATIGTDGKVANLEVQRSVHPDLDAAAMEAVRQWEFDPPVLNCVPSEVQMTVSLRFAPK